MRFGSLGLGFGVSEGVCDEVGKVGLDNSGGLDWLSRDRRGDVCALRMGDAMNSSN